MIATEIPELSTPLAYALAYAQIGWHVLPLEPKTKKPHGRLVPRGMLDATTDFTTIRSWLAREPGAGIGIAMAQSGLVAIDVDPRNGGTDTFDELQRAHGVLTSDVMAYTGGGGEHHVFVVQPGMQLALPGTLGRGVDVKANGYIVVEPSIHPSGKQYVWEASSNPLDGVVPSPLPDWLRNMRAPKQEPQGDDGEVVEGGRNEWLSRKAFGMRKLGLDIYLIESALLKLNADKCSPPLPDDEVRYIARHKAGIAPDPIITFGTSSASATPTSDLLLDLDALRAAHSAISWSIKHIMPADSVGVMFGGSGTFKSFVALDMALHVAHGLPWCGRKTKRGPVIYIAAEGGAGLWRRIEAWHKGRKVGMTGIDFRVVVVPLDLINDARRVAEAAKGIDCVPRLVVVDTLSQTFSGEENSANDVAGYFRVLAAQFRAAWSASVLVLHHSGHQATERPRGSSAIRANVDFMFGVFRDEKEMIARFECHKQKDGESFDEMSFALDSKELGFDEDGDPITSLVATHIASDEDLKDRKRAEAAKGRGGREQTAHSLAQVGMDVENWRLAFYDTLPADMSADARQKAFVRARKELERAQLVETAKDTHLKRLVITYVAGH